MCDALASALEGRLTDMLYQSNQVLLTALILALVLPDPGRWNPFAIAGYGTRVFARDLPGGGRWAGLAGIFLLVLVVLPAVSISWILIYALPMGLQIVAPEASPVLGMALAGILLRLTFWLPSASVWAKWMRSRPVAAATYLPLGDLPLEVTLPSRSRGIARPDGLVAPHEFLARCAANFAAPVLLFAFLGIYAAVIYRVALEIVTMLGESQEASMLAAPAARAINLPAAPAHRLVILFSALAAPPRAITSPVDSCAEGPALTSHPQQVRMCLVTVAAIIAAAFLVTLW